MVYFIKKNKFSHLINRSGQSRDEVGFQWECSYEIFELDWLWWTETTLPCFKNWIGL